MKCVWGVYEELLCEAYGYINKYATKCMGRKKRV